MADTTDVCAVSVVPDDVNMSFGLGYEELLTDKMSGLASETMMVWQTVVTAGVVSVMGGVVTEGVTSGVVCDVTEGVGVVTGTDGDGVNGVVDEGTSVQALTSVFLTDV